ncbi:kinase-like protein [Sodiomyces alkalinus F11]|uniref:Kinase-like protein n=1 Tax=Sodiomyces alkalinus (strain CBS 110278 / VKM F-3762 / F11) TaxID=1314773 RepID=A0A3N2PTP0_SODAK|nr:kinase-like protein [Sodiomyces alkalinus F11]ROT37804.1 kinase-like protein [Sodiomyces alkalinus F11]
MGQSIGTLFPLRFRLWLGRKLYRPFNSSVVRVSRHRVIKGPCDPPEVEAMQYIAEHTTIPVPKVYKVHTTSDHRIYIEMEYVEGVTLDSAWRKEGRLTPEQKKTIFEDIKDYVSVLRALPPPADDLVASALQNPAYDCRIGSRFLGPFTHADFHSLLRQRMPLEYVESCLGDEVAKVHTTASYRTCFTHGDLVPRNIIVRDGRVAALIDWGFAGWYPEYWEFTKAHYDYFPGEDWWEHLREALPCYDAELAAERILWQMVADPGTPTTYSREGVVRKTPGSKPSETWLEARAGRQLKDLWSVALLSPRHSSGS